jgi:hypothetical protein
LHTLSSAVQPPSAPPSVTPLELDALDEELLLALDEELLLEDARVPLELELADSPPVPELLALELVEAPPSPPTPPLDAVVLLLDEVVVLLLDVLALVDEELVLVAALEELLDALEDELEVELLDALLDTPPPPPPVPGGIRLRSTDAMISQPPALHTMMPPIVRTSALLLTFIRPRSVRAGAEGAQGDATRRWRGGSTPQGVPARAVPSDCLERARVAVAAVAITTGARPRAAGATSSTPRGSLVTSTSSPSSPFSPRPRLGTRAQRPRRASRRGGAGDRPAACSTSMRRTGRSWAMAGTSRR